MSVTVREATPAELGGWDGLTVEVPGGQVLQSVAWARHRATTGWRAHHLMLDEGRAVLALERPWPMVGGSRAYLPRGPVTAGDEPERVAERLAAVTAWLAGLGVDVVTTDAELPVASGYGQRIRAMGFRAVEEVEPARHRMSLAIEGAGEDQVLAGVSRQTRQRIRQAEAARILVRRFDRLAGGSAGDGFIPGPQDQLAPALAAFHRLVAATGQRRGFRLGPFAPFENWLTAAHLAGHAIYLEAIVETASTGSGTAAARQVAAVGAVGRPVAGLLIYRQGDRLSTSISGDDATERSRHPGVLHLLRWRAIQLAIREGRAEMDLGGVDVAGARGIPRPGEPMYGLYQHKRSFGAVFVEQVGAHERVLRPGHRAIARAAARLARTIG